MLEDYDKIGWKDEPAQETSLDEVNLNHMDNGIFNNRKAIIELQSELAWIDYPVNLLGKWESAIDFGGIPIGLPTFTVRDGTCMVSGFIMGADPWDEGNKDVMNIPENCLPTRAIFAMGNTNGGVVILCIDPVSKMMKIMYMAGDDPSEKMGAEGLAFQFSYALLGDQ